MKIAVFSSKSYDRHSLERYNASFNHELTFFEPRLSADTVALARGFPGVCIFVNDACDATVIDDLARHGTTLIATRSAGYNQIDLAAAATYCRSAAPFASEGVPTAMNAYSASFNASLYEVVNVMRPPLTLRFTSSSSPGS